MELGERFCRNCGLDSHAPQRVQQVPVYVDPPRSDVERGVDLGCGIFIVLPLIIIGVVVFAVLFAVFVSWLLGAPV